MVRFDATRFRTLMLAQIRAAGYRSVNQFTIKATIPRIPLARALRGISVPTKRNLDLWCQHLGCTPEIRTQLFIAVYGELLDLVFPSDVVER